jgi:hypothetical protein
MANQPPPSFTSTMAARAVAPRRLLHERMRRQWRPSTPPQNALSALGSPWPKSPSSRTGMVPALGFTIAVARRVDASNNRVARVPQAQGVAGMPGWCGCQSRSRRAARSSLVRLLPLKVAGQVAPAAAGRFIRAVFRAKTALRGPGLNHRSVDAKVLIAQQVRRARLSDHRLEQLARNVRIEQSVPALAERGVIPRPVNRQPNEPTTGAFAADCVQHLQQQRSDQALRRNRGSAVLRILPYSSWRFAVAQSRSFSSLCLTVVFSSQHNLLHFS